MYHTTDDKVWKLGIQRLVVVSYYVIPVFSCRALRLYALRLWFDGLFPVIVNWLERFIFGLFVLHASLFLASKMHGKRCGRHYALKSFLLAPLACQALSTRSPRFRLDGFRHCGLVDSIVLSLCFWDRSTISKFLGLWSRYTSALPLQSVSP